VKDEQIEKEQNLMVDLHHHLEDPPPRLLLQLLFLISHLP